MTPTPEATGTPVQPLKVFYSYAREDEELRKALFQHLAQLRTDGLIVDWYDNMVVAGTNFNALIAEKLNTADLILLLVSAPFLASAYINNVEIPKALEREEQGRSRVIPVLLNPVENWRTNPLFNGRQGLPSGDKAVTEWSNRKTALAKVAEGVRASAEQWRSQARGGASALDVMAPGAAVAQAVRIEFVYAPMDVTLFAKIEKNPYGETYEPGAREDATARAYLSMPPRTALNGDLPPFTATAVVCDPGLPELDKLSPELVDALKRAQAFYKTPPSALVPEQRREFAALAGKVLANTFIIAAGVPRLLLGTRVDDLELAYEILLNAMVLPLAAGHAALKFRRFELNLSPVEGPASKSRPVEAHAKKLLKAKFPQNGYAVAQLDPNDPRYFYLYAARFIQWAANRHFNESKSDWLETLRKCFQ